MRGECFVIPTDHLLIRGYTEATQAMVSAMREVGVKRLVLCHSWYTEEASRSQAMFLIRSVSHYPLLCDHDVTTGGSSFP